MNGNAPKRERDDPKQSERFIEAAKKAEADESEEGAQRAFKGVVSKPPKARKDRS
jgi:hypothetical protein